MINYKVFHMKHNLVFETIIFCFVEFYINVLHLFLKLFFSCGSYNSCHFFENREYGTACTENTQIYRDRVVYAHELWTSFLLLKGFSD